MSEKLPLEILKEKYIPVEEFPEKYGISIAKITRLVQNHRLKYAEFKAPGAARRSMHLNPEDVLRVVGREE